MNRSAAAVGENSKSNNSDNSNNCSSNNNNNSLVLRSLSTRRQERLSSVSSLRDVWHTELGSMQSFRPVASPAGLSWPSEKRIVAYPLNIREAS
jgi:hypothetical protein